MPTLLPPPPPPPPHSYLNHFSIRILRKDFPFYGRILMTLTKMINVYFIFHKGFLVTNLQKFPRYKFIMYSS